MPQFKNYSEFINEDGGFATLGNTPGMGDVAPPTSTATGSGDSWPSLFNGVWTANGLVKPKKKRKKPSRRKRVK